MSKTGAINSETIRGINDYSKFTYISSYSKETSFFISSVAESKQKFLPNYLRYFLKIMGNKKKMITLFYI